MTIGSARATIRGARPAPASARLLSGLLLIGPEGRLGACAWALRGSPPDRNESAACGPAPPQKDFPP